MTGRACSARHASSGAGFDDGAVDDFIACVASGLNLTRALSFASAQTAFASVARLLLNVLLVTPTLR